MTSAELRKFLDKSGLTYFWSRIKTYVDEEDSERVRKYIQETEQETAIAGWRICSPSNGAGMSCLASISAGEQSSLVAVICGSDGSIHATGLSGGLDGSTIKIGQADDGSVYLYSDPDDLPEDATMTLVELDNSNGAMCTPAPVARTEMPEMKKVTPAEWTQDKRVDFIMTVIPDGTSPINPLVNKALLDFEEASRKAEDDQIKARLATLEIDTHTHSNKGLLDNYGPAGSASVPAYISADGTPVACTDDFARDHDLEAEAMTRSASDTAITGTIQAIQTLIPNAATSANQLADKAYVDALGERIEARYLGCAANGSPFPTYDDLFPETGTPTFYYQGVVTQPNGNDVTIVAYDETHISPITGNASTTRYRYDGTQWTFEYVINNNALNQDQLLSINSGITKDLVQAYSSHIENQDKHVGVDDRVNWNNKVSQAQLSSEVSSRTAGDEANAQLVASEASAREAADTEEATARAAAISALDARITTLEKKGLVVTSTRLSFG